MIKLGPPSKQIEFRRLLVFARTNVLHGALSKALAAASPEAVVADLARCVPDAVRRTIAASGIRDEHIFATPTILKEQPSTLGYYRLLLGFPQKQFYTADTGLSKFKAMEEKGLLKPKLEGQLVELCTVLNEAMADLVLQMTPEITRLDIDQLPLLTLGVQFDGSYRNDLGKAASDDVFVAIRELVEGHISAETSNTIRLINNSGREIRITLASDPDVSIEEKFDDAWSLNLALEIKGGTDRSNAHNRAGEAEKSHQKVRTTARDFWTLIAMKGIDERLLAAESPTTRKWYDISQILARTGPDWDRFQNNIKGATGT